MATTQKESKATKLALREAKIKEERLESLAKSVGEEYYVRAQLASELLENSSWIAAKHDGSVDAARKYLEEKYFLELSGSMALGQLVVIYKTFPDLNVWKRHRFHLTRLYAQAKEVQDRREPDREDVDEDTAAKPKGRRGRWSVTLTQFQAVQQERDELKAALSQARKAVEEKDRKIEELEQKVRELEQKHAKLEGHLEAMRSK
jgi:predicted RNase H-like nuclease (RuvC/YqgF family)